MAYAAVPWLAQGNPQLVGKRKDHIGVAPKEGGSASEENPDQIGNLLPCAVLSIILAAHPASLQVLDVAISSGASRGCKVSVWGSACGRLLGVCWYFAISLAAVCLFLSSESVLVQVYARIHLMPSEKYDVVGGGEGSKHVSQVEVGVRVEVVVLCTTPTLTLECMT